MLLRCILLLCLGLILGLREEGSVNAAVISIDFSSEWLKVALVKPGVPMEIVLNKESKRKTAAIVALRNGERTFADHAESVAIKYPKNAYNYLQFLLGIQHNSPLVRKYKEWFPYYDIREDKERGTVMFHHDENLVFSPEELLGMLFNYSRELAQDYAGTNIRDVIITIPSFYNQAQRRAVLNAARLVGLNVLQLMTDGAAVALNYGLFRQSSFNTTPFYIMFYDMGATSTVATIAEFKKTQIKEGTTAHIHPQVRVKGVGFDRTLGGLEMEMRLRNHLAKSFMSQHKTSSKITESPRAMAKLLKEAKRVKKVLSANTAIFSQVEGLFEDIDFKLKVTRTEFEDLCSDLFERIAHPVQQALQVADITMGEIESVILVGGGTRVPKVQEMLLKAVKKSELGKSLNTDEAAALGAVYQGASLSKLFRVKNFVVKDANVYPIQVSFEKQNTDAEGNPVTKTVTRTLFNSGNQYPQKKVLTFNKYSSDFDFDVFYGNIDFLNNEDRTYLGVPNITKVHLEGVQSAIDDNPKGEPAGIKVHFKMDESGILQLDFMESLFEYPDLEEESTFSKLKSAFTNLFTSSEEEGKEGGEDKKDTKEEKKENEEGKDKEDTGQETDGEQTSEKSDTSNEKDNVQDEKIEKDDEKDTTIPEGDHESDKEEETSTDDSTKDNVEKEEETTDNSEEESDGPTEVPLSPEEEEEESNTPQTTPTNNTVNETTPTNVTSEESVQSNVTNKVKKDGSVKMKVIKVNLTSSVTQLDFTDLSERDTEVSKTKLQWLQQKDEDKKENERSKNNLESHIFEMQDKVYSEEFITYSTEDERKTLLDALKVTGEWMEEDGYDAETDILKQKLRELKRLSRPILHRIKEANQRPKLFDELLLSLNRSYSMVLYMRNMTEEIFTTVEIKTLQDLTMETLKWYKETEKQVNESKPYEDPVLLSSDIREKTDKLNREIMYLVNKVRNYKPPVSKPKVNKSKTSNSTLNKTTSNTTPVDAEPPRGSDNIDSGSENIKDSMGSDTPLPPPVHDDTVDSSKDDTKQVNEKPSAGGGGGGEKGENHGEL